MPPGARVAEKLSLLARVESDGKEWVSSPLRPPSALTLLAFLSMTGKKYWWG
jgi:hypothetical protein